MHRLLREEGHGDSISTKRGQGHDGGCKQGIYIQGDPSGLLVVDIKTKVLS